MKDKISIIIPAYNVEEYLEKCLESIISQNFDKVEIIIVDDGSTDKSLQIAKEYQKKYPEKTRVISQENKGQGGARNTGIKNATGKYLLFVDSDDTIKSGMLETLYAEMEKSNADIVLFGFEYVDEKGRSSGSGQNLMMSIWNSHYRINHIYLQKMDIYGIKYIKHRYLLKMEYGFQRECGTKI